MIQLNLSVSIIIPTHNRSRTLKQLLEKLSNQTYPLNLIEVIVVADGCTDGTIEMLKNYNAPYTLMFLEQEGKGAAAARNNGACAAKNNLLLFLDDDIEPSSGFVQAHVKAHTDPGKVVIGYLPFALSRNAGFFHQKLWAWWEDKFYLMRNPGYWYSYEDLLSGNFSIAASLFNKVKGFDCTFQCREDYELGARLIKAGAEFFFSKEAWGIHRDEVTDLSRSLSRKLQEGRADVHFADIHPDLFIRLRLYGLAKRTKSSSLVLLLIFNFSKGSDIIAKCLMLFMQTCEWFRLRAIWEKLNDRLHKYWYIRGVVDAFNNRKELYLFLQQKYKHTGEYKSENNFLEIDLENGLSQAEQLLDDVRPAMVRFKFGNQLVGEINYWPGAERLRGIHLRVVLATKLSRPLLEAIVFNKKLPAVQKPLMHSELMI